LADLIARRVVDAQAGDIPNVEKGLWRVESNPTGISNVRIIFDG
jgi:hypothetical protein